MTIPIEPNFEAPSEPGAETPTVLTAEDRGLSQGRLILRRFLAAQARLVSIVLFVLIVGFAIVRHRDLRDCRAGGSGTTAAAPADPRRRAAHPHPVARSRSGEHPFGQNNVGKDYFAMVMRGLVNSAYIMFIIGVHRAPSSASWSARSPGTTAAGSTRS